MSNEHKGWIGVDLDGTLAHYEGWKGIEHIGEPVKPMLDRVKKWLEEGKDVRIFTARVFPLTGFEHSVSPIFLKEETEKHADAYMAGMTIRAWSEKHIGRVLPITCRKDFATVEIWDDRAVGVLINKGVDRETLVAMHLHRLLMAAGIVVLGNVGYADGADRCIQKITRILKEREDLLAYVDTAADALEYLAKQVERGDKPNQDDLHRARRATTKALGILKA